MKLIDFITHSSVCSSVSMEHQSQQYCSNSIDAFNFCCLYHHLTGKLIIVVNLSKTCMCLCVRGQGGGNLLINLLEQKILSKSRAMRRKITEKWAKLWMHFDLFNTVLWFLHHTAFQAAVTWDTAPLFFLPLLRGYWLTKIIPAEVLAAYIKMTSCDFILPERSWHFNKV